MVDKKKLKRMSVDGEFVELPLCPFCNELTDLRGEFTPCCGKETDRINYDIVEYVRLVPTVINPKNPDK